MRAENSRPHDLGLDELEWSAFQYVSGEFDPSERERFEERLLVDQAAREAVSRMVGLTMTIAATAEASSVAAPLVEVPSSGLPSLPPNRSWWQPLGWMAVGALACSLLVLTALASRIPPTEFFGSHASRGTAWRGTAGRASQQAETTALAAAWSASRREVFAQLDETWDVLLPPAESFDAPAEPQELGDGSEGTDPLLPPSWMMAAVEEFGSSSAPTDGAD